MTDTPTAPPDTAASGTAAAEPAVTPSIAPVAKPVLPPEVGGAPGPEPTRYGDWSHKGRCTDF